MEAFLEFEKPIATLEKKLQDLRDLSASEGVGLDEEISALEKKVQKLIIDTYKVLTPWQKVQLSRHPNRPYSRDYIEHLFPDFIELSGDRCFSEDRAIMTGVASWPPKDPSLLHKESDDSGDRHLNSAMHFEPGVSNELNVMIIGHQKGRSTKQKMLRNFGMAKPEGYRKAMRMMSMAERFRMPIITFIDTPGAYPGIDAEERGQSQAIAECIRHMFSLTVPVIAVVIGEGGSGGALAIGVANRVLMMEYGTYSVISPESCASILWSDATFAERASSSLKMGPQDLLKLGVVDAIIKEPIGGAHRDWIQTFQNVRKALTENLQTLLSSESKQAPKTKSKTKSKATAPKKLTSAKVKVPSKNSKEAEKLRLNRIEKFRVMGNSALGKTKSQE